MCLLRAFCKATTYLGEVTGLEIDYNADLGRLWPMVTWLLYLGWMERQNIEQGAVLEETACFIMRRSKERGGR